MCVSSLFSILSYLKFYRFCVIDSMKVDSYLSKRVLILMKFGKCLIYVCFVKNRSFNFQLTVLYIV